ncbi:hypothetical protein M1146_04110, partial [Patescibacteria group bacterium]|nr:hypothetical protein [Patescibacteria group bacterium]
MEEFDKSLLKQLYRPSLSSHKGQNGKLLIVGGSHLFHSASLWSLQVASHIVDMVFYSSVPENNRIVEEAKGEFRNGIVVRRNDLDNYIKEADCILIGPGMVRSEQKIEDTGYQIGSLEEIDKIENEGIQTYYITKYLLNKFNDKKFVIDAGALQMLNPEWLLNLEETPILTPHKKEFERLFGENVDTADEGILEKIVEKYSQKY